MGPNSSQEDNQQNLIISGYKFNTDWHCSSYILKVTPVFDTSMVWLENDTADISLTSLIITPENDYIMIGGIGKDTGWYKQQDHVILYKFDQELNKIYEKTYKLPSGYEIPELYLWQAQNGILYAVGAGELSPRWFVLMKFDSNGDTIKTSYPYVYNARTYCLLDKPDTGESGFYAIGNGYNNMAGQMGRIDIDTSLNLTIQAFGDDLGYSIHYETYVKRLNDTVILLSSSVLTDTIGTPFPYEDNILVKINDNLEFTGEYVLLGMEQIRDYLPSPNFDWKSKDNIFVTTSNAYPYPGNWKYYIAIINEDLNILGTKIISGGEAMDYSLAEVAATTDGGLYCVGSVKIAGSPNYDWDLFVRKFMPEDIITSASETPDPYDSDFLLFPNPGNNILNICTSRQNVLLKLFNQKGVIVLEHYLKNSFGNKINTANLPAGTYIFKLSDREKHTETGIWIKQ